MVLEGSVLLDEAVHGLIIHGLQNPLRCVCTRLPTYDVAVLAGTATMATAVSVCVCAATLRLECNHGTTILQTTKEVELQCCSALQCQSTNSALCQSVYDTVGGNVHQLDRISAHVGELPQIAAVGFVSVVPLHLLGVQCGVDCLEGMNDGGVGCLGACGGDDLVGPLQRTHDAVVAISDNQLHQLAHHGLPALFDGVQLSLDLLVGDVVIQTVKHVL